MNEHGADDEEPHRWQQLNLSDLLDDPSSNGSHSTAEESSINHANEQIQQLNAQLHVQGLKVTRLENRIKQIEKSMATEEEEAMEKQSASQPASSLPVPVNVVVDGQMPNPAQNVMQAVQLKLANLLETDKARREARARFMSRILLDRFLSLKQQSIGQGSSDSSSSQPQQPENGCSQLPNQALNMATHQQQNNIEGFDAAQQPTAHAAEVDDVADAVVDAANVGAADPAAAAAPRPNRRQPENRRQPQQQLFLTELKICIVVTLFVVAAFISISSDLEKQLAAEKARFADLEKRMAAEKAQLENNLKVVEQERDDLMKSSAQKMADLEAMHATVKTKELADLEMKLSAEKAHELAKQKKEMATEKGQALSGFLYLIIILHLIPIIILIASFLKLHGII